MDRNKLNEKAERYIDNMGFGANTNITIHNVKSLMINFLIDNQVKGSNMCCDGKCCESMGKVGEKATELIAHLKDQYGFNEEEQKVQDEVMKTFNYKGDW